MFRAIGRYFRALGYLLTGKVDAARATLATNPNVIRATFEQILRDKKARIHQYKDAVAGMITQEEKKKAELKRQTEAVERLSKLKEGAAVMARKVVERHGGDIEAVRKDPEYIKCQAAFKDFGSTLAEKEERCVSLEADVTTLAESIAGHKIQLEGLLRELEGLKQEKDETVAELITAQEEKEIADMMTGISEDRTSEELQEMRDLREKSKASARVSRELAEVDVKRSEDEFLEYAEQTVADDEFDKLIGLARETAEPITEQETPDRTRLPEA